MGMRCYFTGFLLFYCICAAAAPAVTGVSGVVATGNSITVSGSAFGTKSPAGPALYDSFDSAPTTIASTSGGSTPEIRNFPLAAYTWEYGGGGAYTTRSYVRNSTAPLAGSTYHARTNFDSDSSWAQFLSLSYTQSQVYLSFYYRVTLTGAGSPRQSKAVIWYNGGTDIRYFSTAYDNCETGGYRQHVAGLIDYDLGVEGLDCVGSWCRFENFVVDSASSAGKWHSEIHRSNGTLDTNKRNSQITQTLGTPNQITIGGAYYDMCAASNTGTVDVDNVVVDTTPQRVEVCSGSTWANRGNCDYQPATSWSSSSVTASARVGRWSNGATVYVYVVDSNNDGNTTGYAVTLGAASDTTAPTAPTIFGAESSSTSTIALSWIPGTDAVGPVTTDIERCNGWGCATYASITNTSASNYTDTGLTPGQIYHYRIRSRDGAGNVSAYVATHFNPLPLIPAFPSAEGAGVAAIGGRGGAICRVTNLNDSGAGSLRACTTASGPRTVVFAVAGTINLQSVLPINNPYITIAGQTAPGGGITVSAKSGYFDVIGMNTHNIIIRYIRFARGYYLNPPDETGDTISMFGPANNIVIDHVSARWANDGNLDIWRDDINEKTNNISISNSIFSEPLGDQKNINFGANNNASETMKNIDMHRNYLYGYARNPLVTVKSFRFTNNLVYNYVWEGLNTGGGMSLDAIGNKFKAGPAYPSARLPFRVFPMGGLTTPLGSPSIYVSGNVGPVTTDPAIDNWPLISNSDGPGLGQNGLLGTQYRRTTPLPTLPWPVTVEPATQIESTLLPNVGASRRLDCLGDWVGNRDTVDTRVLDNYANGTGAFPTDEASVGGLPVLDAGTACADTDADGMPDAWESAQGLNQNSAADAVSVHASGYTEIERYINGLSPKPALSGISPVAPRPASTISTDIQVTSDRAATCRYSKSNTLPFSGMTPFSSTGSTAHSSTVTVEAGGSYRYYIKCLSAMGEMSDAGVAAFSVEPMPVRQRRGWR